MNHNDPARTVEATPQAAQSSEPARAMAGLEPCAYVASNAVPCRFKAAPGRKCCFWHDPDAPKTGPLVGPLLVRLASENVNLEGFQLEKIDLECRRLPGALLVRANLHGAYLFKAHLEGAHLFGVDLGGASLFKAQLAGANLRSADLTGANLLGSILKGAKLEGAELGRKSKVANELTGDKHARLGERGEAKKFWHEAEEIYLALLNNLREAGRNEEASELFYRLMIVKRKLMPPFTVHRWASLFMDVLCGYGERPSRVILAWLLLIMVSSLFFFVLGINDVAGEPVGYRAHATLLENVETYGLCVYFSVITMTTTGYGDFTPNADTRYLAAAEAFAGAFLMAVFVLVFARKMMR